MDLLIRGYVDEEYASLNLERVEELLSQVESGVIQRPEVELTDDDTGIDLHLGLVLTKNIIAGWLITPVHHGEPFSHTICKIEGSREFIEGLIYCGAPENIIDTAILQKAEVLEVIDSFFKEGKHPQNYTSCPFEETFSGY
ncbi:MAG: hypothetical protein AAGG51_12050 [Cyanobacteria bacterium P01_G01_bin.54]